MSRRAVRAGTFRHRMYIQSKRSTGDGMGGYTESWTDDREVLGSIWPLTAQEKMMAEQVGSQVTHQVRIRYVAGITPNARLRYADTTTYFDINSVVNPNYRDDMLILYCKEEY